MLLTTCNAPAMLILFLIALLVFGYLVYVLLKPEHF